MLLAVARRHVGAVVALLGISCLLVALVLPWVHVEPIRAYRLAGALPHDYSLLLMLGLYYSPVWSPAPAVLILYLLPVLGACGVAVEGLRVWQGRAATRAGSARLLLGMGCALFGLAAIPLLVRVGSAPRELSIPMLASAGPGTRLASLGFGAVLAGGVLLAVGALLHRWTLRHNDRRASATTTG